MLRRIDIAPDWVCELLSPSTRAYDLTTKRNFYARIGVRWLWYVDVEARTLTSSRLDASAGKPRWIELDAFNEADTVRAEPFDTLEIPWSTWWSRFPRQSPED